MKSVSLALLAGLLLVTTSCGGGKSKVVGKWTVDPDAVMKLAEEEMKKKGTSGPELEMARNMMKPMLESMKMMFEIKADNTFVVSGEVPMQGKMEASGTWKMDGDNIEFTTTMEKGAKKDPPETKKGKLVGDRIEISDGDMKLAFKKV